MSGPRRASGATGLQIVDSSHRDCGRLSIWGRRVRRSERRTPRPRRVLPVHGRPGPSHAARHRRADRQGRESSREEGSAETEPVHRHLRRPPSRHRELDAIARALAGLKGLLTRLREPIARYNRHVACIPPCRLYFGFAAMLRRCCAIPSERYWQEMSDDSIAVGDLSASDSHTAQCFVRNPPPDQAAAQGHPERQRCKQTTMHSLALTAIHTRQSGQGW